MNRKSKRKDEAVKRKIKRHFSPDTPYVVNFPPSILKAYGPIISAEITISEPQLEQLKKTGKPIPDPVSCRLLVDTGATTTLVRHEIAEKAGLALVNSIAPVKGVGIDTTGKLFFGKVVLRFQKEIKNTKAVQEVAVRVLIQSASLKEFIHLDGVLGRDVLSVFNLNYDGPTGKIVFRYKG